VEFAATWASQEERTPNIASVRTDLGVTEDQEQRRRLGVDRDEPVQAAREIGSS
jgi:hypothetical protein